MALEIEIPFSLAFKRASVKKLRMSQLGGFVNLTRAAILEGVDVFNTSRNNLIFYSASTPRQWGQCESAVLAALRDSLPSLSEYCRKKSDVRDRKAKGAKLYFANHYETLRLRRLAKDSLKNSVGTYLSDQVDGPVILQPNKGTRYRPDDIDMDARKDALQARKGELKASKTSTGTNRLTDKG